MGPRDFCTKGKPSYKRGDDAIWYYPEFNEWMIGSIGSLGSSKRGVKTKNEFGGLTDENNNWEYFGKGQVMKEAQPDDINVQSTCKCIYSMDTGLS